MRIRFERLLAGTALATVVAVALAISGQTHIAHAQTPAIKDGVPLPEAANVPPPSIKDLPPGTATAVPAPAAPAQAAAPVAAPASVADSALTDKLRDLVTGKLDRSITRRSDRAAVEKFYSGRNYVPLWIANGTANANAKAAIGYLAKVDRDGLDPAEYPTPDFKAGDADQLADAEIKLTAAVLNYSYHALHGRVHYSRVAGDISFNHDIMEPAEVLTKLAAGGDMAATLDSFQPQFSEYKLLRDKLAEVRAKGMQTKKEEVIQIPDGPTLKPGMKHARVALVRERLDIPGDKTNTTYDKDVAEAVKKFQKDTGIGVDGNVGANTLRALNGNPVKLGDPVDTIIANLDRWRWYPRDLGNPHVIVNIPDFRLTLFKDNKVYWSTKIVVGLPGKATPLISAEMKFITVNPTWNVPPSIIENEYLPALQQDPQALDRIGLKVEQAADGTVRIYQPPGAGNALGRIRFNFPNKFLVYQHDTPDKHLFARDRRAFSHGCMRVQNPLEYGEKLLSLVLPEQNYTAARLEKMFGGSEININFPESKHVKVHLTYQSAFVDDDGKLQLREDVYGRDQRMIAILKGSERKIADIGIERPPNTSAKPVRMAPGSFGDNSFGGGPNFFELLFGGGPRNTFPARRRYDNNGRVSAR